VIKLEPDILRLDGEQKLPWFKQAYEDLQLEALFRSVSVPNMRKLELEKAIP
jgi:hypothetical protein